MKIVKTLFFVLNEILAINLLTFFIMFLGLNELFMDIDIYYRILILSGLLSFVLLISNIMLNLKFKSFLALKHKARVYFVLMFTLYATIFALSQQNASYFMIYTWVNLPVYYYLQSILPHQFDLWMQFGLSVFFILPSFAILLSDYFSQWFEGRLLRTTSK